MKYRKILKKFQNRVLTNGVSYAKLTNGLRKTESGDIL